MPRLVFAENAERDLTEIGDFIARDNAAAAAQFVMRIHEHCQLLAARPNIGRERPELAQQLRSFPLGRYVIFYRAVDDRVEIVRVLHGARDLRRALNPD